MEITMKIGNPADKPVGPALSGTPAAEAAQAHTHAHKAHGATQAAAPAAGDASAKVEISSTASTLLSGGTSGDFDASKVAQVSDSIANGTFKVNPDVIADKLIGNAKELLSKVQS
jgi:negative regulator of flagellin synthesis FlgM